MPDYSFTLTPDPMATAALSTGFWAAFAGIWIFILILALLGLALWIWALVDISKRNFSNPSDKNLWLILLIVSIFFGLHLLMAIIYLLAGRKKGTIAGAAA